MKCSLPRYLALLFVQATSSLVVSSAIRPVHAQPSPEQPSPEQPSLEPTQRSWYTGVSPADQEAARQLLAEAADLKSQLLLGEAIARYEEALSHWDHPELQFELATVLMKSAQYLRAHEHLHTALDWGPNALPGPDLARAREMATTLMTDHLATIVVRCDQTDAEIKLDGKPLPVAPGAERIVVRPGEHVITARKAGYFPIVEPITLVAGNRGVVQLSMSEDRVIEKRRWSPWTPWAVVGAGVATGLFGTGMLALSERNFDRADGDFRAMCQDGVTCAPTSSGSFDRAGWQRQAAISGFIAGGVVVSAGLVMAFLNRPESLRTEDRDSSTFELETRVSPDGASVTGRLRF